MTYELETAAAVRWVAGIAAVALCVYLLMGTLVTEDAALTRYGRQEDELAFVRLAADNLDREATWGDRPVIWLIGSSITREGFDAEALREHLGARGRDVGVEKFAFNRGAPILSWMMLQRLDVRPGDVVVTTVAYDNFREGWLDYHRNAEGLMLQLLTPDTLVRAPGLSLADRLEASVVLMPPRSFWLYRDSFREGLSLWLYYALDPTVKRAPAILEQHELQPFQNRRTIHGFEDVDWIAEASELDDDDIALGPGQVNWDALRMFVEEVEAAGARPWVLFLPHSPKFASAGFISEELEPRFQQAMREAYGDRYHVLPRLPTTFYMDYRHPNSRGREVSTRALAELLAD